MQLRWIALAVAAAALAGVYTFASMQQHAADKAKADALRSAQVAAGATLQAGVNAQVGKATDSLAVRARAISTEVSRGAENISLALGDGATIEPVVLAWSAGIDRLREPAASDADEAVDRGPPVDLRALSAQRETGDATTWLAGYEPAETGRPTLRGRCDAALGRLCGARPLDWRAV